MGKMKNKVTNNSLLEAHIEALPKDPEIMKLLQQQVLKDYPREGENPYDYPLADFCVADEEQGCDLDMLYYKLCEDERMLPITSMLLKLTASASRDSDRASIDLQDFRLNDGWCNVIKELITKTENDPILFAKDLILKDNDISDQGLTMILEAL